MKIFFTILVLVTSFTIRLNAEENISAKASKFAAKDVTVEEADKLIAGIPELIVLDVRTPEEFEHEHIKGAVNVNLFDSNFLKLVSDLDQSKPLLVHCASGRRSVSALTKMAGKTKFPAIYHMHDGFNGWKNAKKPFESKPLPKDLKYIPAK